MTLSITVLVMEGTGALQMIVPIMLAVFISKMVGDTLSLSIYDVQVKIRGAPALVSGGSLSPEGQGARAPLAGHQDACPRRLWPFDPGRSEPRARAPRIAQRSWGQVSQVLLNLLLVLD